MVVNWVVVKSVMVVVNPACILEALLDSVVGSSKFKVRVC